MLKAYKYRIYPTAEQRAKIDATIGCCRLVYNLALEIKIYAYQTQGISLSGYTLEKDLVELKNEFYWFKQVDSQALQASVKMVDISFKNFFNGSGYPKFKNKLGKQSFVCPNVPKRVNWNDNTLTIAKIPNIPIVLSRRFDGEIKKITISKTTTNKYFASILVDNGIGLPILQPINPATTIGLDTGIKSFVISSDGRTFEANRKLKDSLKRLKCLQRRASRKVKGSTSRKKANKSVAILHEKITNKRLDYIHKVTHELTSDNQATSCICIEDLNVSGLLKNHKLAQAMSDVSLGKFYDILSYKCAWRGINLIKIDRFAPSSKRCSTCGSIKDKLPLSERTWTCLNCSTVHDRDNNAAENIKYYGLKLSGMGSPGEPVELSPLGGTMKQESLPNRYH